MFRKIFSLLLTAMLAISTAGAVTARADAVPAAGTVALEAGTYEDGQVLVTIASPEDTPLTEEGTVSFDENICVDHSWELGDARILGKNDAQREFLEDKSLYVATVSSDEYSTPELLAELDNQAYVVSVEPDYYQEKRSINDTLYGSQWYLDGANAASEGIHYASLAQSSGSTAPVVAVVDTGIDYTHEDLAPHMWKNTHSSLKGTYGYDFGDGDADPMDVDEDGHGTHCAGIIGAAANNSTGIAGICSNVRLMALKVFNYTGKASNSAIINAFGYIYDAQKLGVNVAAVNCSWGGGQTSDAMKSIIQKIGEGGAVFVFAAGNDGVNHDASSKKECPYDMDSPYIVKVGGSDMRDARAGYSDYGAASVDLFAPGVQILSTVNYGCFFPAILPASRRNAVCSYYSGCDSSLDTSRLLTAISVFGNLYSLDTEMSRSTEDAFGDAKSGSLCISPSGARSLLDIYFDVTDLDLSFVNTYYVAYDFGLKGDTGAVSWEHMQHERSNSLITTKDQRTYLLIAELKKTSGLGSDFYLDNLSISVANPDVSAFGKYTAYSGTSMAAPSVTAAVAVLASTYPKDTAVQRRERLLTCVRKVGTLSGYCKTGGILDLSKVKTATYKTASTGSTGNSGKTTKKVTKVKLNKSKATLRYKGKLKLKATVKPTNASNKKVKWYVSNKKYATVTQKGVVKAKKKGIGHTVTVYAKAKDGSGKKGSCKVKIKKKKK